MRKIEKISWSELLDALATLKLGSSLYFKMPMDTHTSSLRTGVSVLQGKSTIGLCKFLNTPKLF